MKLITECENDETCSLFHILAGGETSLVVNSLGYTIFTYFLRFALHRVQPAPGSLLLSEVFEECKLCAEAFSSIIIRYDKEFGFLRFSNFSPSLITAYDPQDPMHLIQACDPSFHERTVFVWMYYQHQEDEMQPVYMLHRITTEWLDSLTSFQSSPLQILEQKNFLEAEDCMLLVVITLLIRSIASIELACNNDNVADPNLFLLTFLVVMATLDRTHQNIEVTLYHLMEAAVYYAKALIESGVDATQILKLMILWRSEKHPSLMHAV